jgi:hypothetical protein
MTTTTDTTWAGYATACAEQTPVTIGGRRFRITGLGTCPQGRCTEGPVCPGLLYLHTDDTGTALLALPAVHLATGLQQYRLEIVTDPDPDTPVALIWFRADGIAAAIAQARRLLATLDGPDDQYGELYQRNGHLTDFLTTLHLGA